MRYVWGIMIAMGLILIAFPLGLFVVAWLLGGPAQAVAWATAWLTIYLIVFTLIPLAIFGVLVVKGLPWTRGKVAGLLDRVQALADRSNGMVERLGRKAISPDVWLYSKYAWLRGFLGALRREYLPRRS